MRLMRRIKLFEGFSRSHPKYTEQELRQTMSDCLVELNDIGTFQYSINMDLNDNYIVVLIFVDESYLDMMVDVPDDEYWNSTKTFDCTKETISEPVMLLTDYMKDTFGHNLYTEYWVYDFDSIPHTLTEYPTNEYLWELQEEGENDEDEDIFNAAQQTTKLMIKYKW